ncbi:PHD finger protein 11 isoform X2 [Dendrobates tinctorius]|uniref:PHD finger protein 11 isoform X2 n=1 Tax=Dendrobates tinctorius TaxID=92724 RepID=UPI003CC9F291
MSPQDTCAFCGLSEETKDTGKLQNTLDGSIVAHYNCMLYSPRVTQIDSQEDTEGFGFNTDLVNSEINRGRKLPCSLCKQRGATVGCFVESCKKTYHYPCLIKAKGRPIPDKFIVYCDRHKPSSTPKDSWRLQTTKKRKRLQKATSRPRNSNIRNRRDNDDSKRWQRARKRTKLQNTAGRSRKNDIRNQYAYNVDPHPAMQNVQSDDQQETTLLLAIDSAEIEDSEEALPSTSGQPMSSGTNSEESDSILNPKVKDTFSLCGFPKRKMKHISNRKPSKKLQEILQKITPQEKKDLSQIYSELGGSESYRTIEMDVTSDNQTGEITTDNPMITDDTETSTCSDNYDGDKTPERLPEINEHGIPSRYSSDDKHFTEEQTVSSQDEKIDRVSKSSYKRKKNLDIVISRLSSTLFSDSDILDRSGMSTLDAAPCSAASKSIRDETSVECYFSYVQPAKDLQAQGTSETHPSGHSSMTEPESTLCSPLTLEKGGIKSEVSPSISDSSVEKMENDLSTSPLSNGEVSPVASPSNVKTLLNEKKTQNKRAVSNIASPQQIMAISKKLGTLAGQLSNFVPQIQRTIKSREQNGDGQAISKGSRKPNTNDQPVPREVLELRRLRSSEGWIENGKRIRRLLSVKTSPAENNLGEPLRNQETSDDAIRKKESITSKRKRFQDSDEVLSNMSPQRTEDSLLEETETPGSEVNEPAPGHHSGPSQRITPFRRRLNRRFPRDVSQSSFQHKRVEDLDDMDGFSIAVAGQCRTMQEDRQAIYMSYVLASANLFRGYAILPNVEVLIGNLRNELDRFQQSSSCGAYGSSD